MEAATGRLLWKFRVSPNDERIPVYGSLINRWPVAGGVVVDDDSVYAAAGIAHYDGTYVVKLDAKTGEIKAHNSSSGTLSDEVNNSFKTVFTANRDLQRQRQGTQTIADHFDTALEVCSHPVHLVDERYPGDTIFVSLPPYCL